MGRALLIIGNGFDLSLNLKTSYSDFINSRHFLEYGYRNEELHKHLYDKHEIQNWIDVELELKKYALKLLPSPIIPHISEDQKIKRDKFKPQYENLYASA